MIAQMTTTAKERLALVTGSAGFIGFHLCQSLLAAGWRVIGIDNLSPYYDVKLKQDRQEILTRNPRFSAILGDIADQGQMMDLFAAHRPQVVVHLAAQAGVRYSIDQPRSYLTANICGTFELLEAARAHPPAHMLLASTSSVYGASESIPFVETNQTDHPLSFYAATKKAGEAMAHSYAHLYDLPITMFRFFTVYGPWGRPDMALHKFTKAILQGSPIDVYNQGQMRRDFTYIDDLVSAICRLMDVVPDTKPRQPIPGDSLSPIAPFRIVNIGNSVAVPLMEFIAAIELATGRKAVCNMLPMQAGDVPQTWADASLLQALIGDLSHSQIKDGIAQFVAWYRDYYRH